MTRQNDGKEDTSTNPKTETAVLEEVARHANGIDALALVKVLVERGHQEYDIQRAMQRALDKGSLELGSQLRLLCLESKLRLVLDEPSVCGTWIQPKENGQIYAWNIRTEQGLSIALMTANDQDLQEQRRVAKLLVEAFNSYDQRTR